MGLSRAPTRDRGPSAIARKHAKRGVENDRPDAATMNGHATAQAESLPLKTSSDLTDGRLFTADELAKAMSKSTLEGAHPTS